VVLRRVCRAGAVCHVVDCGGRGAVEIGYAAGVVVSAAPGGKGVRAGGDVSGEDLRKGLGGTKQGRILGIGSGWSYTSMLHLIWCMFGRLTQLMSSRNTF
jgi:hypothetical protein